MFKIIGFLFFIINLIFISCSQITNTIENNYLTTNYIQNLTIGSNITINYNSNINYTQIITNQPISNFISNNLGTINDLIPKITFIKPKNGNIITNPYDIYAIIDDNDLEISSVKIFFYTNSSFMSNIISNLFYFQLPEIENGSRSIIISASDKSGKTSSNAIWVKINNPKEKIQISWIYPTNLIYLGNNTNFLFSYKSENSFATNITIFTNSSLYTNLIVFSSNSIFNFKINPSNFINGSTNTIITYIYANSGYITTNSNIFIIDYSKPIISNLVISNISSLSNKYIISGISEDLESDILNTTIIISNWATNLNTKQWSILFDKPLYGGVYPVLILLSNKANNYIIITNYIIIPYFPKISLLSPYNKEIITNNSINFFIDCEISEPNKKLTNLKFIISTNSNFIGLNITTNVPVSTNKVLSNFNINISEISDGIFYSKIIAYSDNGNDNNDFAETLVLLKDIESPIIEFNTNTIVTNIRIKNYEINFSAFDYGSGIDKIFIINQNLQYESTNRIYGIGQLILTNQTKNINLIKGTNNIKILCTDKIGRMSSIYEKIILVKNTIIIDGTNDFDEFTEKYDANSDKYVYITYDDNNIYFGFENEDMTIDNKVFYIVISTNKNYGSYSLPYGAYFEGSTVNLPIRAQFLFYFKRYLNTEEKYLRKWNGAIWDNTNRDQTLSGMFSYNTTTYSEYAISRNLIGNPDKLYIITFCKYLNDNEGWGWLFGACPDDTSSTENANDGIGDKTINTWIELNLNDNTLPLISLKEGYWKNNGTKDFYINFGLDKTILLYTLDNWTTTNIFDYNSFSINDTKTIKILAIKTNILGNIVKLDNFNQTFIKPSITANISLISTNFNSLGTKGSSPYGDGNYQPYDRIIELYTESGNYLMWTFDNWTTTNFNYENSLQLSINTSITCKVIAVSPDKLPSSEVSTNFYRTILQMQKDVGLGNSLYFTGDKPELTSWGTGRQGRWTAGNVWEWVSWTFNPSTTIYWKVRLNGSVWESDPNHLSYGATISRPTFNGGF